MDCAFPKVLRELPIEELKPITSGGVSYNAIYHALYLARQLRYVCPKDFKKLDKIYPKWEFPKFCTKNKMKELADLKYLEHLGNDMYTVRDRCKAVLEKAGFLVRYLPEKAKGIGDINARNNVEVFIQAHALPNFYTLLFKTFGYIEPDAILVQNFGDTYQLTCLEIEKPKSDWLNKLTDKRENYFRLAKDLQFYEFWKETSRILKLKTPNVNEFRFNVTFVCSLVEDFGEGFNFINEYKP